jgi:hypothetical protein
MYFLRIKSTDRLFGAMAQWFRLLDSHSCDPGSIPERSTFLRLLTDYEAVLEYF